MLPCVWSSQIAIAAMLRCHSRIQMIRVKDAIDFLRTSILQDIRHVAQVDVERSVIYLPNKTGSRFLFQVFI